MSTTNYGENRELDDNAIGLDEFGNVVLNPDQQGAPDSKTVRVWSIGGYKEVPVEDTEAQPYTHAKTDAIPSNDGNWKASDITKLRRMQKRSSNPLKKFVENAGNDAAVLVELAAQGNQAAIDELEEERQYKVAQAFVKKFAGIYWPDPDYENYNAIVAVLEENQWPFDLPHLEKAFYVLQSSGELLQAPDQLQSLSQVEKTKIGRRALSGDVDGAILDYIILVLPESVKEEVESGKRNIADVLAATEFQQPVIDAIFYVWSVVTADFIESRDGEFLELVSQFVAEKPLTFVALQTLWKEFKQDRQSASYRQQVRQATAAAHQEPEPTVEDINNLSDDQVRQLWSDVRHQRAAQLRRQRGAPSNDLA